MAFFLAFWRPVVEYMVELRCALALCPRSIECECLFSLSNSISRFESRFDGRNLTVALREQLFVVI